MLVFFWMGLLSSVMTRARAPQQVGAASYSPREKQGLMQQSESKTGYVSLRGRQKRSDKPWVVVWHGGMEVG